MKKPLLFILSGCSGVGKNAVWERIEQKGGSDAKRIVTTTSRQKRPNENHGNEYYFISREEFEQKISAGEIFEWTITHGTLYGSTKKELEGILEKKHIPVYMIDVKGLINIKEILGDAFEIYSIFILPPSFEALEQRLRSRGTESDERIRIRLQTAKEELEHIREYDYLVINDDIDVCADEIIGIMANSKK